MSNHDYVFPHVAILASELLQMGMRCPAAQIGNRFPTKQEVQHVIVSEMGLKLSRADEESFCAVRDDAKEGEWELEVSCYVWDRLGEEETDSICIRGNLKSELLLLRLLAARCGQLVLHPDTGDPPVIVDERTDVERTNELWLEAIERTEDSWEFLFEKLYSSDPSE